RTGVPGRSPNLLDPLEHDQRALLLNTKSVQRVPCHVEIDLLDTELRLFLLDLRGDGRLLRERRTSGARSIARRPRSGVRGVAAVRRLGGRGGGGMGWWDGSSMKKTRAPPGRAHTEPARAGHARHARRALSEFWNAWSACLLPFLVEPHARVTARFVAESEKVTFDVKYFRPETSNPVDEFCDGLARR